LNATNPDASCNAHEVCICNFNSGSGSCLVDTIEAYGNPKGSKSVYDGAINCQAKCSRTDLPCLAKNCKSAYCKHLDSKYADDLTKLIPKCANSISAGSDDYRGDNPFYGFFYCDAAYLQYSVVLAVAAVFALLL